MNAPATRSLVQARISVRWGDMDAFNHVNNAVYASFLEEARIRWFAGIAGGWMNEQVAPMVAAQTINYRAPIEWPAEVVVELTTGRIGNTSLTLAFALRAGGADPRHYADGSTVLVWIDRASGRPVPLPAHIRAAAGG